jgi:hypothetical protein
MPSLAQNVDKMYADVAAMACDKDVHGLGVRLDQY